MRTRQSGGRAGNFDRASSARCPYDRILYNKFAPEMLSQVDSLLERNKGREKLLVKTVKQKYEGNALV